MPPLILWLLDGRAFVICSVFCLGGFIWMSVAVATAGLRRVLVWAALAGLVVLATSTPIAWPLQVAPLALSLAGLFILRCKPVSRRPVRVCGLIGVIAVSVVLWGELRWWPRVMVPVTEAGVVVIGDSLSAGIGGGETIWPRQLADAARLDVVSVAFPGARIADGRRQLARASVKGRVVVVLLGGNDMLGRGSAEDFYVELEELVLAVRAGGGRVLLIEFPVLPAREGFGQALRTVATKHGVPLLHRRFLAAVLQAPDATVDGLHLSESGHRELARMVKLSLEAR
ncbi:MAG: SGNH/GDSL hydrolase family protein [Verrucomicrobiota bacterium]